MTGPRMGFEPSTAHMSVRHVTPFASSQNNVTAPSGLTSVLLYVNFAESLDSMHVATQVGQLPCNLLTISTAL